MVGIKKKALFGKNQNCINKYKKLNSETEVWNESTKEVTDCSFGHNTEKKKGILDDPIIVEQHFLVRNFLLQMGVAVVPWGAMLEHNKEIEKGTFH
ncbi:hypothetical protein CDAR_264021 [Caerostris darwini]|uniref:Uncharacterized protein n=1 Tax=Caerostris darwini TaxID=1538125 RepID=A0AAV4TUP0_9ARAC|nr:hypothetical protein CDAR_264021 [Caerostris darwini]